MAKRDRDVTYPDVDCKRPKDDPASLVKRAIEDRDFNLVLTLQKMWTEMDLKAYSDQNKETFLHYNAVFGNCAINRLLFLAGCPIDATDISGETALVYAIQSRNFDIAEQLIEFGANVNIKNNYSHTALLYAASNVGKDWSTIMALVPLPKSISEARKDGQTVDEESLWFMQPGYHAYSLPYRIKLKKVDDQDGQVPTASCRSNSRPNQDFGAARLKIVKKLLNAGADVNEKDKVGFSIIHGAVCTGDLELVTTLINAEADVDKQNGAGATALHEAVLCGNEAMVRLLLSRGAKVNVRMKRGNTPLHCAVILKMVNKNSAAIDAIIKELLKHPVDVNTPNEQGHTPFTLSVWGGDLNFVRYLIGLKGTKKANIYESNALHYADKISVFNLLLESEKKYTEEGRTALHFASEYARPHLVRFIIARGADVNAQDASGKTPLLLIINKMNCSIRRLYVNFDLNRMQTIQLLLEAGTDVNQRILQQNTTILKEAMATKVYGLNTSLVIIDHVARTEARTEKPVFNDFNLTVINENLTLKDHYVKCRVELQSMKNSKIGDSTITHLAILTEPPHVLLNYAKNKEVVKEFNKLTDYKKTYPIYGTRLRAKFNPAIARMKLIEQASVVLCTALQFADPTYVFYERTLKYISDADIKLLIDSAAVHENKNL